MVDRSAPASVRHAWDRSAGELRPLPETAGKDCRFIKGPLPYAWMQRAGQLPGRALNVALGLWYKKGLCFSTTFPFKRKEAMAFGASADAVYDALKRLEDAGLISVERHRGRSPIVTILDMWPR